MAARVTFSNCKSDYIGPLVLQWLPTSLRGMPVVLTAVDKIWPLLFFLLLSPLSIPLQLPCCSRSRVFASSVSSAWNAFPPNSQMTCSLMSITCKMTLLLKCHLTSETLQHPFLPQLFFHQPTYYIFTFQIMLLFS